MANVSTWLPPVLRLSTPLATGFQPSAIIWFKRSWPGFDAGGAAELVCGMAKGMARAISRIKHRILRVMASLLSRFHSGGSAAFGRFFLGLPGLVPPPAIAVALHRYQIFLKPEQALERHPGTRGSASRQVGEGTILQGRELPHGGARGRRGGLTHGSAQNHSFLPTT